MEGLVRRAAGREVVAAASPLPICISPSPPAAFCAGQSTGIRTRGLHRNCSRAIATATRAPLDAAPAGHYPALRNTLWTVIGLFAVYLVFEFMTLWFRSLPPGFYYAGYARERAAWLTVALALAT